MSDDIDVAYLPIDTKEGPGLISVESVTGVLADKSAPKSRSLILTESLPEGLSVETDSASLSQELSERRSMLRMIQSMEYSDYLRPIQVNPEATDD